MKNILSSRFSKTTLLSTVIVSVSLFAFASVHNSNFELSTKSEDSKPTSLDSKTISLLNTQVDPNLDTDSDGIPDIDDLDDDNDGVPDIDECSPINKRLKYEFYDFVPIDDTVDNIPTSNPDFAGEVSNFEENLSVKYHGYGEPSKTIPFSLLYTDDCLTFDTDADGIPNILDLDSDGDGCSDALEAGATTDTTDDFSFPASSVGSNGLSNSVESAIDSGEINYTSLYSPYAVSDSIAICTDSDGDGVLDIVDLDDDNDGVPDSYEQTDVCEFVGPEYDFESASITNDWSQTTNLIASSSPTLGSYSAGSEDNRSIDAVLSPAILEGGDRPESFEFYWQETTDQSGWTGQFINSFDDVELEVGGNNPQWEVKDGSGTSTIYDGDGYDRWIYYKFTFDWQNGEYTYYMEDLSNNHIETGTRDLSYNLDIKEFRINNSRWGSADYFWIDNIKIGMSKFCGDIDTDGDGTPDRLDLDSDGDGCSDALEAGATTDDTDNFAFPTSGVGANGFADSLESIPDNGEINYDSTYYPYATSKNLAACIDTDGDGIMDLADIDDDNDGIQDHIESPGCFLLKEDVDLIEVTTSLTNYSTSTSYLFEELYDGVDDDIAAYGSLNTEITDETVYEFVFDQPVPIQAFLITHNYSIFQDSAVFKIQGYNGSTWVDLSEDLPGIDNTNTTNTYTISKNEGNYSRYRFYGISGKTDYNRIYEIDPIPADSYNPSLFPKIDCVSDTDGDSIFNHQDLDSDGDGCSDGVEGSSIPLSENNTSTFPTGDDTSGNGLLDTYSIDLTDSFYTAYAIDSSINACTDTDGDDVVDVVDIDDDNDGIPDIIEDECSSLVLDPDPDATNYIQTGNWSGLNNPQLTSGTSWSGSSNSDTDQYVGVLFNPSQIKGVTTKGRGNSDQWVITYELQATKDGNTWISLGTFNANSDRNTEVFNRVSNTDKDWTGLRINPKTWKSHPSLRFQIELYDGLCPADSNGNGIPNSLELDSDGDGCSDALEAGATTDDKKNFAFPTSGVGANGLADNLETSPDSGEINYDLTYSPYATSANLAGCVDTDGDGIMDLADIDDDNDGILDHVESPGCFLLKEDVDLIEVTTSLTNYSTNTTHLFEELYDGVYDNHAAYGARNTSIADETVYEDGIQNTNTTNTYTISQNEGNYSRYRFYGISGETYDNRMYEIDPIVADDYNPSLYPKADCNDDFDGDGVFNHHDLDSDDDGCNDALEGGATTDATTDFVFTGAVGTNGLADSLEITADNGDLNYEITYNEYALTDSFVACIDTDNDGIKDIADIDDDNDGILDDVESPNCFLSETEIDLIEVNTSLTNYSTNTTHLFEELYDGVYDDHAAYGARNTRIANQRVRWYTKYQYHQYLHYISE